MLKLFCFYGCCENNGHHGHHHAADEDCGCGCGHSHGAGEYEEEMACDCGGCGCEDDSHGCGDGCGCGCGGHQQAVLISFDDGTEYECPVLSIFDVNEQEYIALYHPERQKALLYRFKEDSDGIFLENIDDEEEFQFVAKAFQGLQE
ncbi:hypothetical protein C3V36_00310 [Lachnospiraceae bacterium oral taxon 500]|nr:hypothetical protein C3V36_00310 [Lachnospiraceae bacterium oral taxon 500]